MRRREAFLISGVSLAAAFSKPSLAYAEFCELTAAGPLQYCDIKVGKGSPVKEGDRVDLVYQGIDAKTRDTFDSSPSDEPLDVILGNDDVIIGWEMGIAGGNGMPPMRYGGVRKVIIPSKLAYGAEGYGCRYDITRKRRGGMDCMVDPYDEIEMVFKILDE